MFRKLTLAIVVAALATPLGARAHEDEFETDWGWIDDDGVVIEEEYFEDGDVSVDMAPGPSVSFETFEEELTPYGEWVTVGAYGRVWRPRGVAVGWRPYYHGHWAWTHEGWLWVSAEPWGWATYHYGRWAFDPFYGWFWVPGYVWAPAWVSWRFGVDFIGWAPLAPGLSVYVTNYPIVYDRWCFVPVTRFVGVPVHSVALVGKRVPSIFSRTQPAPPRRTVQGTVTPAWGGPARPFVEKRVGRPIAPVRVQPVASPSALRSAPAREGIVRVFRPEAAPARPRGEAGAGASALTPSRPGATPRPGTGAVQAPPRAGEGNSRGAVQAAPRAGEGASRGAVQAAPRAGDGASRGAVQAPPRGGDGASRGAVRQAPPPSSSGSSRSGAAQTPRSSGSSRSGVAPPRSGGSTRQPAARPDSGGGGGRSSRLVAPPRPRSPSAGATSASRSSAVRAAPPARSSAGVSAPSGRSSAVRAAPPSRGSSSASAPSQPRSGGGAAVRSGGGGGGGGARSGHSAPARR